MNTGRYQYRSETKHAHTHTQTKAVVNRLSRAIGHLESVKKMVENGQDCSDVLIQLAAVRAALTSTGKLILKDHLDHCIVDAVSENGREALEKFKKAMDQFVFKSAGAPVYRLHFQCQVAFTALQHSANETASYTRFSDSAALHPPSPPPRCAPLS